MTWLSVLCSLVPAWVAAWAGYRIGWQRGNALTPNDYVLRDVVRQRDHLMRERDDARQLLIQCERFWEDARKRHLKRPETKAKGFV